MNETVQQIVQQADSLQVTRLLAQTGKLVLRANGTCMYPILRSGDRLHIDDSALERVRTGDIVIVRRDATWLAHRTIATGCTDEGFHYIVTRPDSGSGGDDGPTFAKDFLGVVSSIERNGRHISPEKRTGSRIGQVQAASIRKWKESVILLQKGAVNFFLVMQQLALYRFLMSGYRNRVLSRVTCRVQVPFLSDPSSGIYRTFAPEQFTLADSQGKKKSPTHIVIEMITDGDTVPAVKGLFSGKPMNENSPTLIWMVETIETRIRYRGLGLEEQLLATAGEILEQPGLAAKRPRRES